MNEKPTLKRYSPEIGTDYIMVGDTCWITVKNLSVYIIKTDEGVAIDIYPHMKEEQGSIAGTWALFDKGKEEDE